MLLVGVVFELPVFTFFFARVGIVNKDDDRRGATPCRIFIVRGVLTPGPDCLAASHGHPLFDLYVASIGVAYPSAGAPASDAPGSPLVTGAIWIDEGGRGRELGGSMMGSRKGRGRFSFGVEQHATSAGERDDRTAAAPSTDASRPMTTALPKMPG